MLYVQMLITVFKVTSLGEYTSAPENPCVETLLFKAQLKNNSIMNSLSQSLYWQENYIQHQKEAECTSGSVDIGEIFVQLKTLQSIITIKINYFHFSTITTFSVVLDNEYRTSLFINREVQICGKIIALSHHDKWTCSRFHGFPGTAVTWLNLPSSSI